MNHLSKKEKLKAAKLISILLNKEIQPDKVNFIGKILVREDNLYNCLIIIAKNCLVSIIMAYPDENIFGLIVDYLFNLTVISVVELEKEFNFNNTQEFLLTPVSPFGFSRREEKYEKNRFSPVKGPNKEILKNLGINPKYTVIDMQQNPKIKELFDNLI